MAKKNAREEPPKPQVSENEQMSDIVFILDKMELILEAVSQIGQDGKFNTVAADRQNRNSWSDLVVMVEGINEDVSKGRQRRLSNLKKHW